MRKLKIYLSGSVKKEVNDKRRKLNLWTKKHEEIISTSLNDSIVEFDNPNENSKKPSANIFRRDLDSVMTSDIILVDLSCRRGIGVGIELYHAQIHEKIVIAICQTNSYYRQSENIIHPFAKNMCDYIVENLGEAIELIRKYSKNKLKKKVNIFNLLHGEIGWV